MSVKMSKSESFVAISAILGSGEAGSPICDHENIAGK